MKQKVKNWSAGGLVFFILMCLLYAFAPPVSSGHEDGQQFLQLTTVESIIPGGLGRSRMFVTWPSGKQEEFKMKNLYSMVGINMSNLNGNDIMIVQKITELAGQGWELVSVSTGVQSPAYDPQGGKGEGIFLTRYLFRK